MSKLVKTNVVRRRLTKTLTKGIGSSSTGGLGVSSEKIKRVLISRPNHRLGNLLLITPLIQEVERCFPEARIDLFVKGGLSSVIFRNYSSIDRIIPLPRKPFSDLAGYLKAWMRLQKRSYDLVINVDMNSSSGRLSTQFARGKHKLFGEVLDEASWKKEDREHFGKRSVCALRSHSMPGQQSPVADFPFMDLKLSPQELMQGNRLLKEMGFDGERTISLFTYATGAKCYSESWWEAFYERLQAELPEYRFVEVLPVENISRLSFRLPTFYSRDVREIGSFIAATALYIGADSGITHLASATGTACISLFSVTSELKYGPYHPNSRALHTRDLEETDLGQLLRAALRQEIPEEVSV